VGLFPLISCLVMGATLVVGERLFPNFTIMWFASPEASMILWRQAFLTGIVVSAVLKELYDPGFVRVVRGLVAVILLWQGTGYFFEHPAFIFDSLFMLSTGVYFAIAALQKVPSEFPALTASVVTSKRVRHIRKAKKQLPSLAHVIAHIITQAKLLSTGHIASTVHILRLRDIRDDSHRLVLHT
jgi:hypothetical protein